MKQKRPRRARGGIDFTKANRAIIDAYESGLSEHAVAMEFGIETSAVQKIVRKFSPGSIRQRSKAKASSGKPTAAKEAPFILTPNQLGRMRVGDLLVKKGPHIPVVLHTLIYVAGASKADVAKMTGLTRGRIGHYLHLDEPVPEDRERQFYEILRDITEGYEENLALFAGHPEFFDDEMRLVPEAGPVAREIVKACRKVLANYEAAHQPKVNADQGEDAP